MGITITSCYWGNSVDSKPQYFLVLSKMFRELEARSYIYRLTKPKVRKPDQLEARKTYILGAELGPEAGLLGACILGLEEPRPSLSPGKDLFVY